MNEESEKTESTEVQTTAKTSSKNRTLNEELCKYFEIVVNTEDFICEIQKYPALWDSSSSEYCDKNVKLNSWESLMVNFDADFKERPSLEKEVLVGIAQKKWRHIKLSYNREVRKKKEAKNVPEAKARKQYVYFEQLRFLETLYKKTSRSMDEDELSTNNGDESDNSDASQMEAENCSEMNKANRSFKKKRPNTEEVTEASEKRGTDDKQMQTCMEEDADRMFILSLLPEIRKVPSERKLKLKADFLAAIANAQNPPKQLKLLPYPLVNLKTRYSAGQPQFNPKTNCHGYHQPHVHYKTTPR